MKGKFHVGIATRFGIALAITWCLCATAFQPWSKSPVGITQSVTAFWWNIGERAAIVVMPDRTFQAVAAQQANALDAIVAAAPDDSYDEHRGWIAAFVAIITLFAVPFFIRWTARPVLDVIRSK